MLELKKIKKIKKINYIYTTKYIYIYIKTRFLGTKTSPGIIFTQWNGKVQGFSKNKTRAPALRVCKTFLLFSCLCLARWYLTIRATTSGY